MNGAVDMTTRYLGLDLKHPLVPSASPLSQTLDGIRRLEDAGASAVVMYSLFEEQIEHESLSLEHYLSYGTESYAEALSFFPEPEEFNVGPDGYLELIRAAKGAVDIPIIGSLNGASPGGWTHYAKLIQEAGADALELNIYHIATDPSLTGEDVERKYLDVLRDVRELVSIPVAVKLSPYFSSMANFGQRLARAGATGLVLFNRFYQPDFDLDTLEVGPHLVLSSSDELRLPLRWIAILYGRVTADFALTTGVHSHIDALKGIMAGASVTMLASELLRNGVWRLTDILEDMQAWMTEREYASVNQMKGSMSQQHVGDPEAFERANYMRTLQSFRFDPTGLLM
jgi:dihydroorotate dehydrogenase (fumarate)